MKKKIKIAIFHCGFIYSGGGERIVLEEARGLIKRGYDVEVYAPTIDSKKCFPELLKELKVKIFLPSYFDKLPLRNAFRMIATSILAPLLAYKFRDVDVFIGANQPSAWIAFCMAKILGKPYIVYLNQPNRIVYPRPVDVKYGWHATTKDYEFVNRVFKVFRPIVQILDRISIIRADRVLVNGGYIGDIVQNIFSIQTIDAPAGSYAYSQDRLNLTKKKIYSGTIRMGDRVINKPYVLITNRHDPQKRFDYVIRAMVLVLKGCPKASLIIPGPFTDHTKHLIKMVKRLKIEEKVQFLGQISESQLQGLYKNCTVYCYPSPQEDFGLGPLEAGGWAVPSVAWNHAGPTITVENKVTGFLAKPYKVSDYSEKIIRLIKDPSLRIKMGKAAWYRTKNNFSWEKHVDMVEETIKKIL